jgi:hypothetical protein
MSTFAKLCMEYYNGTIEDGIQNPFESVRDSVRRLGRRFQAANALLSYAQRLPELRNNIRVRPVPTQPECILPPADMSTNFDSIAVRMLPANSAELESYQQILRAMDVKHQLFQHFIKNYRSEDIKPYVHAEVQMLEYFYKHQFSFADGDPFIACSRPVCFSCLLYFRHHPGRFVEPLSHRKVCLSWRPPEDDVEVYPTSEKRQKDILNGMTKDIRKEALDQLLDRCSLPSGHPGFPNRVPELDRPGQDQNLIFEVPELLATPRAPMGFSTQPMRSDKVPETSKMTSSSTSSHILDEMSSGSSLVYRNCQKESFDQSQLGPYDFLDESDEEGGVFL